MAIRVPGFMERMARRGLGVVQPAVGLAIMARALAAAWRPLSGQPGTALFTGIFVDRKSKLRPTVLTVLEKGIRGGFSKGPVPTSWDGFVMG